MLTIIMYHYVRELARTRYPAIKGRSTSDFEGQLDYITKHYTVIGFRELHSALADRRPVPKNACVLTFDDGFLDHYHTVFPRLLARGVVGCFFPPVRAIEDRRLLDVHKIHFILASAGESQDILTRVLTRVDQFRDEYDIPDEEQLYASFATQGRLDPPEVVMAKKLLQRGLPEQVRSVIVDELFADYVRQNEATFATELYMDLPQLRCMAQNGMEIGGHGYRHVWLETLSESEQREEIDRTVAFLSGIYGERPKQWTMCYPYGSYNDTTVTLLEDADARFGLTTRVGLVSDLSRPFALSRLDTNEIPCSGNADVCEWTSRALESASSH